MSEEATVVTRNDIPIMVFSGKEHSSRANQYCMREDGREFKETSEQYANDVWNYKKEVTWDIRTIPHVECK